MGQASQGEWTGSSGDGIQAANRQQEDAHIESEVKVWDGLLRIHGASNNIYAM